MTAIRNARYAALALVMGARTLTGQSAVPPPALGQAFDLERQGRFVEAGERFRAALDADPTSVPALLGLERVLTPLGHVDSLIPPVQAALRLQPTNRLIHAIELRSWANLGRLDSLRAAARRWIAADSTSADVYREWAYAVAQRGSFDEAQHVLEEGQQRLGGEQLLKDLAQMAGIGSHWGDAARYWRRAVLANPELSVAASMNLERTPAGDRDAVLEALLHPPADTLGRRLAADLLVGWDRAGEGWTLLDATLPAESRDAIALLQRFADRAGVNRSRDGLKARGYALERLGNLLQGPAAARARVQAARAFAEGGDQNAAERVLERVATDGSGDSATASAAMATLIGVMAQTGRVEEAERRFGNWASRLPADQADALRLRLARAWLDQGMPDRADTALGADSSAEATALRGWAALHRGDVSGAATYFTNAGPFAGSRAEATDRTEILAVLQRLPGGSNTALGSAFRLLAKGDTTGAIRGLAAVAKALTPDEGQGDVLALAGRLAVQQGSDSTARGLFTAAVAADSTGPAAPGAELRLAELEARGGEHDAAIRRLEHLIIAYTESAVVPQARRLLDQLRGAVPKS